MSTKKFGWITLAVVALASSAQAALVIHLPDLSGTPGQTGQTFEVYVTTDASDVVSGWNVGLQLSAGGTMTITNVQMPTTHTSILGSTNFQSRYTVPPLTQPSGYVAGRDEAAANIGNPTTVVNGSVDGLFKVTYSVPSNPTQGSVDINIDLANTFFFDGQANEIPFTVDAGSFVVPEPTAMGLALFALPLLARRRR